MGREEFLIPCLALIPLLGKNKGGEDYARDFLTFPS